MLAVQSRDDQIVAMQGAIMDLREIINEPAMIEAMLKTADQIMSDQTRMARYWRSGYEALALHAQDGVARAIGRRILTGLGAALIAAGIWISVKLGVFK